MGRWRREKWEREPVSISLTTLFRPFLSLLDSAVKTVNTSVSYSHSQQVSRASISRDANPCANVWESSKSIRFFPYFFFFFAVRRLRIRQRRLRISHSIVESAADFIAIKKSGTFFPLLDRLCPGRWYIFTEQVWF